MPPDHVCIYATLELRNTLNLSKLVVWSAVLYNAIQVVVLPSVIVCVGAVVNSHNLLLVASNTLFVFNTSMFQVDQVRVRDVAEASHSIGVTSVGPVAITIYQPLQVVEFHKIVVLELRGCTSTLIVNHNVALTFAASASSIKVRANELSVVTAAAQDPVKYGSLSAAEVSQAIAARLLLYACTLVHITSPSVVLAVVLSASSIKERQKLVSDVSARVSIQVVYAILSTAVPRAAMDVNVASYACTFVPIVSPRIVTKAAEFAAAITERPKLVRLASAIVHNQVK